MRIVKVHGSTYPMAGLAITLHWHEKKRRRFILGRRGSGSTIFNVPSGSVILWLLCCFRCGFFQQRFFGQRHLLVVRLFRLCYLPFPSCSCIFWSFASCGCALSWQRPFRLHHLLVANFYRLRSLQVAVYPAAPTSGRSFLLL